MKDFAWKSYSEVVEQSNEVTTSVYSCMKTNAEDVGRAIVENTDNIREAVSIVQSCADGTKITAFVNNSVVDGYLDVVSYIWGFFPF